MPFSDNITWSGIMAEHAERAWPRLRSFVERAIARGNGEYLADDILDAVKARKMQLWAVRDDEIRAVVVTEVLEYPRSRKLGVVGVAGEGMRDYLHLLPEVLEAYAKEQGCTSVRAGGREGWVRALAVYGYERTATIVEKDLGNG